MTQLCKTNPIYASFSENLEDYRFPAHRNIIQFGVMIGGLYIGGDYKTVCHHSSHQDSHSYYSEHV